MNNITDKKEPEQKYIELFEHIDKVMPVSLRNNKDIYLNLYKYWNDFLIKDELPSYEWLINNIFKERPFPPVVIPMIKDMILFQFLSKEFIKFLAESIKNLKVSKIIEIGAGDGFLSHFLQVKGINIIPTDSYKISESVEKLNHKEALEKYNPDVVLICWEEYEASYSIEALNYPSVKCVIWVGELGGCTGCYKELRKYKCVDTDNPYCLARTDSDVFLFFPD